MNAPPLCRSSKDHWQTPGARKPTKRNPYPIDIRKLIQSLAPIGLDTCTSPDNPMGAQNFFTVDNPAPNPKDWPVIKEGEQVYQNHPYSANGAWCEAFLQYWDRYFVTPTSVHGQVLANASSGTRWFEKLSKVADAIAFLNSRVAFFDPVAKTTVSGNLWGTAVWYFGDDTESFKSIWAPHATIVGCL
jgi:hypothetical protein